MQLENRTAVLARAETTYGVDSILANLASSPSPMVTDAMMLGNLDLRANGEALTRENYSTSLSKDNIGMGRMLLQLTFRAELKASGSLGIPPRIGRLIRACGFQETVVGSSTNSQIAAPQPGPSNVSSGSNAIQTATVAKTTAPTQMYDTYRLTVTVGGAPGAAKWIVTGAGFPENDTRTLNSLSHYANTNSVNGIITVSGTVIAPVFTLSGAFTYGDFVEVFVGGIRFYVQPNNTAGVTLTALANAVATAINVDARTTATSVGGVVTVTIANGSATTGTGDFLTNAAAQVISLGQSGAQITIPVWTGTLVAGEYWDISLNRPGVRYDPISDNATSLTFWVYLDGSLFRLCGARGTFTVEGQSAKYPVANFTFTAIYQDPIDAALPTSLTFETSKPYKVELSQLSFYGVNQNACASRFAFDIGNTVEAKDCINASEGYDEIRITDRSPTMGADPQAEAPSLTNPWARMRREDTTRVHVSVGRRGGPGNIVRIQADEANFRDAPFANRNRIRAYDYQMHLARVNATGNDECFLHFG